MITIGFSTRKIDNTFVEMLKKTSGIPNPEVVPFENNGEYSLTEVYNKILNESSNDIVILCHDDIYFDSKNWGQKILNHFKRKSEYGILGLAGTTNMPKSAKWWEDFSKMKGIVNHEHEGKKWESKYSTSKGNEIDDVVLVDGLFIVVNKNKIKHNFDESIKGFHFYDIGFCLPNYLSGVKVGVMFDVRVTHLSIGQTNQQWEDNRVEFSKRYENNLPIDINDKTLCETFIFVHDQNLILDFETKSKFSNLYKYTYVFLGNRPTDKLGDVKNVLIARDYDLNLEEYPLFTSYTGWYFLWKNNLIKTKYITLLEYDVILDKNFDQIHTKFLQENVEMVGYVPFPMNHYQFVMNPEWNEHILPIIQNKNKVDLVKVFNKIVQSNPNAVWSSTSNTTFRTDIFNEYMKWFEPIGDQLKETKTCGHAHERSITYFAHIMNKKMMITNKILQHLQLDSHKTQGHEVNLEESLSKL